jgi:hypothetical protein
VLPYFILGIALLASLILISRWYVSADPKTLVKVLKWLSLGVIVIVALFLAITGRLAWAFAALPALFMWFMRFRSAARTFKNFSRMAGAASGAGDASSEVETRYLRMSLDHASGDMDGEILEGPHKGRHLRDLDVVALVGLLEACWSEDEQSAQVLEAYLDRLHPDWRDTANNKGGNGFFKDEMDVSEALDILGLDAGAEPEQIKEAHHRLIAGLHPDHGGSTYLAAKINRAKDVLLS